MNQQCKVCGEPAAGFHFGAFTCEGCKSFFGRTYNNLSSISECKNNGECVINKKNRTACKACRLRKCLYVGMSKSGSRYGRRSNWFKIHCLLQEQQQQHEQHYHQPQSSPPPSQPSPSLSQSTQSPNHHHNHHSLASQFNYVQSSQQPQHQVHHHHHPLHQNNNKSPSPLKSSSLPSSPCLLTNPFISSSRHLLNGSNVCPDKIASAHHRRTNSNSSSDSGASSADPDDSIVSHKDIYGSPIIDSQHNMKLPVKKFDPVRSISEPLNPYLMLPLVALSPASPHPAPALLTVGPLTDIQDEPIDLSVKSQARCETSPPKSTVSATDSGVSKVSPLDLTLVRTDTLSG